MLRTVLLASKGGDRQTNALKILAVSAIAIVGSATAAFAVDDRHRGRDPSAAGKRSLHHLSDSEPPEPRWLRFHRGLRFGYVCASDAPGEARRSVFPARHTHTFEFSARRRHEFYATSRRPVSAVRYVFQSPYKPEGRDYVAVQQCTSGDASSNDAESARTASLRKSAPCRWAFAASLRLSSGLHKDTQ